MNGLRFRPAPWLCAAVALTLGSVHGAGAQSGASDLSVVRRLVPGALGQSVRLVDAPTAAEAPGDEILLCLGDPPGDEAYALQCFHRSLAPLVAHEARLAKEGVTGPAFRERICRDVEAGVVAIPDRSYMLSATGRRPAPDRLPDSVGVTHFVYLPRAQEATTGLPAAEPAPGQPWLHHAGRCTAHLMWSETRRLADSR